MQASERSTLTVIAPEVVEEVDTLHGHFSILTDAMSAESLLLRGEGEFNKEASM